MQITPTLNLVFPIRTVEVQRPDPKDETKTVTVSEPTLWAFHSPISQTVFEANYRIIAATKTALFRDGKDSGERMQAAIENVIIATLAMRDAARRDAAEYGTEDQGPALEAEITRLTMILVADGGGFSSVPVDIAIKQNKLTADEWRESLAQLVFFTVSFAMSRAKKRTGFAEFCAFLYEGSMTPLTITEFAESLKISTGEPTSAAPSPSLVPS